MQSGQKRLAFPNENVYFSWYSDFSSVREIDDTELSQLALSGLITLRPGVKIIKTESNPKVYAVAHGGVLRWISTEELAKMIYGVDWTKRVVTISDAFISSYKFSGDITAGGQYWWAKERDASPNILIDLDETKSPDFIPPQIPSSTTAPTITETEKPTEAVSTVTKNNVLFVLWDPKRPQHAAFDKDALNRVAFGIEPSVADYYEKESSGKVQIVKAGILGWYDADKPPEHYWSDDALIHQKDGFKTGAAERISEALKKADADFDFKKFDTNNDGRLAVEELAVFVVIPQYGKPADAIANAFAAEDPASSTFVADGISISSVGEIYLGTPLGDTDKFGAIAHCFARHIFNLSDISVGAFSLMSSPFTDLHIDPYNRIKLGWLTPKEIPKIQEISSQILSSSETNHPVIKVLRDQPNGPPVGSEYFLIENRERGMYDNSLPDTGLAVWDVNGGSVSLRRFDSSSSDDTKALWAQSGSNDLPTAKELSWSDNVRSGVRLLNVGNAEPVMAFTLEKKILTADDLVTLTSPIN